MRTLLAVVLVVASAAPASAQLQQFISLREVNDQLAGQVLDFTHNHGSDNRIWSPILGMSRDLYVYLPPGYSPDQAYPLVVWLHGGFGDEHSFLDTAQLPVLDAMIRCGCCPPMIVACPDGTCNGRNLLWSDHSFYVNGCCGRFEDHIIFEIVPRLLRCFSISPCRCHHALVGVSAGGFGAFSLAIQHRDFFGVAASLAGAVNMRYDNIYGEYLLDFHPATYRWKTSYDPRETIGQLANGLIRLEAGTFVEPVFGRNPGVVSRIARVNPADLIFACDLQPGDLALFVSYGTEDNLNMDAQGASFVWLAGQKGVGATVHVVPEGGHSLDFFRESQAAAWRWLGGQFQAATLAAAPLIIDDPLPLPE